MTEELQGPSLGIRFREVSTLIIESKKMTEEQQGPTLGVQLKEVSAL